MAECVLVSGGSGGIGGALCRRFASAGYLPVIAYSSGKTAAGQIATDTGGIPLALDLESQTSIDRAIDFLSESGHVLAGVVLAASPPPAIGPIFRLPAGEMDTQWKVNVLGPHALLAGIVRNLMRPRKKGWVVGILSEAMGMNGGAAKSMGGYIVAKYGLMGLLKVLQAEYAWLDVQLIFPGYTETAMLEVFDPRFLDQMRAVSPDGRFAAADDVAEDIFARIRGL